MHMPKFHVGDLILHDGITLVLITGFQPNRYYADVGLYHGLRYGSDHDIYGCYYDDSIVFNFAETSGFERESVLISGAT